MRKHAGTPELVVRRPRIAKADLSSVHGGYEEGNYGDDVLGGGGTPLYEAPSAETPLPEMPSSETALNETPPYNAFESSQTYPEPLDNLGSGAIVGTAHQFATHSPTNAPFDFDGINHRAGDITFELDQFRSPAPAAPHYPPNYGFNEPQPHLTAYAPDTILERYAADPTRRGDFYTTPGTEPVSLNMPSDDPNRHAYQVRLVQGEFAATGTAAPVEVGAYAGPGGGDQIVTAENHRTSLMNGNREILDADGNVLPLREQLGMIHDVETRSPAIEGRLAARAHPDQLDMFAPNKWADVPTPGTSALGRAEGAMALSDHPSWLSRVGRAAPIIGPVIEAGLDLHERGLPNDLAQAASLVRGSIAKSVAGVVPGGSAVTEKVTDWYLGTNYYSSDGNYNVAERAKQDLQFYGDAAQLGAGKSMMIVNGVRDLYDNGLPTSFADAGNRVQNVMAQTADAYRENVVVQGVAAAGRYVSSWWR